MTTTAHSRLAVVGMALSSFSLPVAAAAQVGFADQAIATISRESLEYSDVVATDANDSLLVVLTEAEPVLHLFRITDGAHLASWGRMGEGPGEFQSSAGVALAGNRIYALDTTQRRLMTFTQTGAHVETIRLGDIPYPFADKLYRVNGDTVLIGSFEPMGWGRAVTAWTAAGSAGDVLAYQAGTKDDNVRLEAPDAPGLTLPRPFRARPEWAADPRSGRILYWPGHGHDVQVVDLDGVARDSITLLLDDRFEVTPEDREHWFAGFPSDFKGQRVFEPLKRVARDIMEFPDDHPLFYQMMAGPRNTVWVRRTPGGRQQAVWDVASEQRTSRVMLREGYMLLALHNNYGILLNSNEESREALEVHLVVGR